MAYHYRECGLDNVFIDGVYPCKDDDGDTVVTLLNINDLHKTIAEGVVGHAAGMSGKEMRFLRTEAGMTQAELAQVVHHDTQSVGRWERGEVPIEPTADALIRLMMIERLKLDVPPTTIAELSSRCVPTAAAQNIVIDGNDPEHYRLAA